MMHSIQFLTIVACLTAVVNATPLKSLSTINEACIDDADCNGTSLCLRPGFQRPTRQAQKYCYQCNCTMFEQCKLICGIENERLIYCDCAGSGFTGKLCETNIDDCDDSYCLNGGTCVDGVKNYTCSCPLGYTGRHCEINIDDCDESNCLNGGTCDDGVNNYTCACPSSYTGRNCEIYEAGEVHGSATPQCITSSGYPLLWYSNNLELTWNIFCPAGQRVRVFFLDFVVERYYDDVRLSNGECTGSNCPNDILILSGNADPTYEFIDNANFYYIQETYDAIQVSYFSNGNVLTMVFNSDSSENGKGFKAEYNCVP
ncbi:fibropellin-3-like isoform X2 [Ruditapes philippinarum]|uniref:fibropellin-3-like isoform X2 n=1 Tax=Ruditapes philippinarum TaxID=129788 RepID=UPI00295BF87B|nr:fibropellin-3-like isoform X2 [Ruditapes philippinarum]